jgi:hypothetical protein
LKKNIKQINGKPYTPTTQGMIERLNQTILNQIKRIVLLNPAIEPKKMLEIHSDIIKRINKTKSKIT